MQPNPTAVRATPATRGGCPEPQSCPGVWKAAQRTFHGLLLPGQAEGGEPAAGVGGGRGEGRTGRGRSTHPALAGCVSAQGASVLPALRRTWSPQPLALHLFRSSPAAASDRKGALSKGRVCQSRYEISVLFFLRQSWSWKAQFSFPVGKEQESKSLQTGQMRGWRGPGASAWMLHR